MVAVIGRGRELARFGELLDEVTAGVGRVVALAGAAGVGKSRLAAECLARAEQRGFLPLRGTACVYQGDLSYAPVVEALRPLVRTETWCDGLADLGRLFGGLPFPPPAALENPGLQRTRLFEAIIELLRRTAAERPVALLVDDVHWADGSSLDVLHYLGRAVARLRCVVVLTYRPAEAGKGLRGMLSSLRRDDWLIEVPVSPLRPADIAELVRDLLGDLPPGPLLDLLAAKAGGVPLFVRELTLALRDNGRLFRSGGRWVLGPGAHDTIPVNVTELFEERVGSLDPADRAVLEAVSVCADVATADVIDAVCPDAADRLDELCANGLIESGAVYRAVHPLLAEAVYALMPVRTRQAYHAAVADAVDEVSRRAYHIGRAGSAVDPEVALEALCAAAKHAVMRQAGEEGMRHAQSAIDLARRLGRADLVPGLLVQLAESASCVGRSEEAIQAWRDAAEAGDRAACLLQLAQVETDCGRLMDANKHLAEAVRLAVPDAIGLRIDIAQVSLVLHTRGGSPAGVLDAVIELERIADPRAQALARYARLELTGYGVGTVAEAEADAAIREVSAVAGVPLIASLELISMGTAAGRGEHAVVGRRVQRSVELVRAAGLPVLEAIPTAFWALAKFQAGAWDSALVLADRALVLAHRVDSPRGVALALAVRALVLVHRGEVAEAEACVEEAASYYRERRIARLLELIGAQLALTRGDLERAVRLAPAHGPFAFPVPHWQVRVEACRLTGDHKEASRAVDELDSLGFPYARAVADMVRGGPSRLAGAATALDALALPFDAAVCRLELAEALTGIDQQAAIAAASQAMAVFDDLDAVPRASQARRLLRGLGARPKPRERRSGELSARETEIALLVAQGMANTTIAHQLYISPRTVTTHLERIYRRLGLSSRHDLTRYMAARNT